MRWLSYDGQFRSARHVDGDRLRFEARTAVGELYDAFVLNKQRGQINLLEEIPAQVQEPQETRESSTVQAVGTSAK